MIKKIYSTSLATIKEHNEKIVFIIINISIALMGFLKSYVTMKFLDFYSVGLIAMMQALIDIISIFQLGFLNGGFRMYFLNTPTVNRKVNNVLFTYFSILSVVVFIVFFVLLSIHGYSVNLLLSFIACIVGVFSLAKNWVSNIYIALGKLRLLSTISFLSTFLSILFIFLVPYYGLLGAILLIVSQPLIFLFHAFLKQRSLLPTYFLVDKAIIRKLFKFGFIPFLMGIIVRLDSQVERWGIVHTLGLENLGKYNLVLIYCSLFYLVPSSLMSIFYPKAIGFYKSSNIKALNKFVGLLFFILFVYIVLAIGITVIFLPKIIQLILPRYYVGIRYVWYIFPYLIAQTLIMPLDLIYNVYAKFRIMFISYTVAFLVFCLIITYVVLSKIQIDLIYFPIAKSVEGAVFLLLSFIGYKFFFTKNKL